MPQGDANHTRGRCAGTSKRGEPCRAYADPGRAFCLLHDPERVEEMRALCAARGRNGNAKRREAIRDRRMERVPLGTVRDIRTLLERAAALVEGSGGDAAVRSNAIARIATVALQTIQIGTLETEVAELRAHVDALRAARERSHDT